MFVALSHLVYGIVSQGLEQTKTASLKIMDVVDLILSTVAHGWRLHSGLSHAGLEGYVSRLPFQTKLPQSLLCLQSCTLTRF